MNVIKQGLSLAVAVAGLAALPGFQAHAAESPQPSLIQQMRGEARGDLAASVERSTGRVGFLHTTGNGDLLPGVAGGSAAAAAAKADAYLQKYASAFGASWDQLHRTGTVADRYGHTVTYTQSYHGIPVFGAELKANLDAAGDLTSVNGFVDPVSSLSTTPRFTRAQAAQRAVATVKADPPTGEDGARASVRGLHAESKQLVVYRQGALKAQPGPSLLAYEVVVGNGRDVRDVVILDANTNKPVNRYSQIADDMERHLVEANGSKDPSTFTEVWKEGDAFPGALNQDQQNEVQGTGDAYWFFKDTFGRDSYDAAGHSMTTVNNDGRINCPNANWNGTTTNYCNGVTSDDVVAHEWGHAYTEYTSGLIYQWQSGAMNEAYSDIWGETVDLINGRLDEGEGDLTAKRPVGLCSSHSPANPVVSINSPQSIARTCLTGGASYGPQLDGTGITSDVVVGLDGTSDGGTSTTDGCSPLTNAADVAGKIVLLDRGTCTFTTKTQTAQNAGAAAVIIGNRDDSAISPSGTGAFTIPTVTIGLTDREVIKSTLAGGNPVNVTMKDASGDRYDSYRWLMGEKSPAFGGAIRDMWNPTCYGDPGKVSDAEYKCSTDDNGGVHGNSGVVNHSYALLVDGGTYNGVTVTGLGLDKAANIYFRAQTNYLTPTSDFADLADALQASCTDLVGQPINQVKLSSDGASAAATPIASGDCASVTAVANAVELRTPPVQCNFQPVLAKNAPAVCGQGTITKTDWSEAFENGLGAWTASNELTYAQGKSFPWTTTTSAPDGHAGTAAYAADPTGGSCGADANDYSSRDSITSPAVTFPTGTSPRLVFDHYVASEAGWDGGNVKVSVNGGAFTAIPSSAFVYNAPNSSLNTTGAGNTGPMAGQAAWTGTDGGEPTGSWGQSQVDLSALSAVPGDSLKFRFDFGRDGCGGIDGWYVDNVKVVHCQQIVAADIKASHTPEPAAFGSAHSVSVTVTGEGTPSGNVTVSEGGNNLGSAILANGAATVSLPTTMAVGSHSLKVSYSGDDMNGPASTTVTATVSKAASTTTATHSPEPATYGQAHSVSVKVTGGGTPTGTVTVSEGGNTLGSATLANGTATVSLPTTMAVGTHSLTVSYAGDGSNTGSSTTVTATVSKVASATTATGPESVKVGKTIKAAVTVTASGATPTGTVQIWTGGTKVGTGTLSDGKVVIAITKDFPVGKHTFTAKYLGSATVAASRDSFTVKIVKK